MAKRRIINEEIPNISQPWGGTDAQGPWGYDFEQVEAFLKRTFGGKIGLFYYDTTNNRYLCFADEDARDAYLDDPVGNNSLLLGTFDAPFNYSAHIHVQNTYMSLLKGETGVFLEYTFEILNKEGGDTGDNINVTYTFSNGSTKQRVNASYASGTTVRFLADKYLKTGENRVTIAITGASTLAATTQVVTIFVVDLQIESSFDITHRYEPTDSIAVPYAVSGMGVKTVECFLDDGAQPIATKTGIAENNGSGQFAIDLSTVTGLGTGRHWIQLRASLTIGGVDYYSKTLFFHFMVGSQVTPQFLFSKELGIGELNSTGILTLEAVQYEDFSLQWALYHPTAVSIPVTITTAEGTTSVNALQDNVYTFTYQPMDAGTQNIVFAVGEYAETLVADVEESDLGINEFTEDMLVRLSAVGRSNEETDRDKWMYDDENVVDFTDFEWNANSGWNNNALVIKKGTQMEINVQPFLGLTASVLATRGVTVEIDFETDNVDDEDASVIVCGETDANDVFHGLRITATSASLTTQLGTTVSTKFKPKDRQHLCFTMNSRQAANPDRNLLTIVNDGKIERAVAFDNNDSLNLPSQIVVFSENATIKIYSIRVYARNLTVEQCFANYAIDSPDRKQIVSDNDVLTVSGNISYEKVRDLIPTFLFTTDSMNVIFNAQTKKDNIRADVEYHNPQEPTRDFTIKTAYVCPQGTSSLAYPIKNLRLYTQKKKEPLCVMYDAMGNVIPDGKYSFKEGAQPVNCWTLKADYAESSMSHNTGTARLWNQLMKDMSIDGIRVCRTRAMVSAANAGYQYDVRLAIDGFPCCVFYRQDENSEPIFMGQFNFDNDKSTESVYGFKGLPDDGLDDFEQTYGSYKDDIECWELLNNASDLCLFRDDKFNSIITIDNEQKPAWEGSFEARYPDDGSNADTTHLQTFASWLVGLKNMTAADKTAFATQKWEHLDVYKVAAYYVYCMRHGAVDQLVKNSMLTSEGYWAWKRVVTTTNGVMNISIEPHQSATKLYYFQWYDNDTIHGIDNDSQLKYGPYIDRQTLEAGTESTYVYAGHASTLWNLLEADEEFMSIVQEVDGALGDTYAKCCDIYDVKQSSVWPARLYNASQRYKYIDQFRTGTNRLYMLQGSRTSHRHWWLKTRFDMYDSRFVSNDYRSKAITFRVREDGNRYSFTVVSGDRLYYAYGINKTIDEVTPEPLEVGQSVTFHPRTLAIGDPVKVFGASHITKLDVSDFITVMNNVDLSEVLDDDIGCRIKSLILGKSGSSVNNICVGLSVNTVPTLEELDITNFLSDGMRSIVGLDGLSQLHKLRAGNSALGSVELAEGVSLSQVILPDGVQILKLNKATLQTGGTFTYTPTASLLNLTMKNCVGFNELSLLQSWMTAIGDGSCSSRILDLEGIDWTDVDPAWLCDLATKDWQEFTLRGKVLLTEITPESYNTLTEIFGEGCFEPTAPLFIDAPPTLLLNMPEYIMEGESVQLSVVLFPASEEEGTATWSIFSGSRTGTTLTTGGLLTTTENGNSDATLTIRCMYVVGNNVYSQTKNIVIKRRIYPDNYSSGTKIVTTDIDSTHIRCSIEWTTEINTEPILVWSFTGDATSYATMTVAEDGKSCVIAASGNYTYIKGTVSCQLKKLNGNSIGTKSVSISFFSENIAMTRESNQYAMALMYSKGFAANQNYMTKAECAAVTNNQLQPGSSSSKSIFYNNSSFRSNCKAFPEFKYFTGISIVDRYLFYQCNIETIELPPQITKIHDYAFSQSHLKEIVVPNNVTAIGQRAFSESKLESIVLPISVTSIETYAFYNCKQLLTAEIKGCNSFGTNAFQGCTQLESVILPSTGPTSMPNYMFSGCTSLRSANIPSTVNSINEGCFYNCPLESLTLPSGLQTIGINAFFGGRFTTLHVPPSVSSIGGAAFGDNNKLDTITVDGNSIYYDSRNNCNAVCYGSTLVVGCNNTVIPSNISTIQQYAFHGRGMTEMTIPSSVTTIGQYAFCKCANLESITIPNSVTSMGTYAFAECTSLASVTLSNNLELVNAYCFQNCSSLTVITIPNGIGSIGNSAFSGCTSLATVSIPSSVTTINSNAFYHCSSLTAITIPNSVTTLQGSAFSGCTKLESVVLSTGITALSASMFYGCTKLSSINIPSGVTMIDANVFRDCTSLTSVTLPNGLTTIGNYAFKNSGLTSIVIPNSVTTLNNEVFSECASLVSVTLPSGITSISQYMFKSCSALTTVNIPSSITTLGAAVFEFCTALKYITLPNSITSIGNSVFDGCTNLINVTLSAGLTSLPNYTFSNCAKLKQKIPTNITSLGEYSFSASVNGKIFFESATPPTINGSMLFIENSMSLYVPYGSLDDYKNASGFVVKSNQIFADFSPTSAFRNLSITAPSEVSGLSKKTMVDFVATADGYDEYLGSNVTGKQVIGRAWSDEYGQNPSTTSSRVITVSLTIYELTATTTTTQLAALQEYVFVDLNNQWESTTSVYTGSAYNSYKKYRSFSNYHIGNAVAKMRIIVKGYTSFTFKISQYCEQSVDFVVVSQLDQEPPAFPNTSGSYTNLKSNSSSYSTPVNVTFDNLDGGEHVITIIYGKNSSSDYNNDRGYVLISTTYNIEEQ